VGFRGTSTEGDSTLTPSELRHPVVVTPSEGLQWTTEVAQHCYSLTPPDVQVAGGSRLSSLSQQYGQWEEGRAAETLVGLPGPTGPTR
jgi:hypothetical protein